MPVTTTDAPARRHQGVGAAPQPLLWRGLAAATLAVLLAACAGPPALRQSVLNYDETTSTLDQELMLLNIARISQGGNPHFTVTGSIAATFDFSTNTGLGGTITQGGGGNLLNLSLGSSASENPTFQIIPVTGQDFTRRLVSPLPEEALSTLVFQGDNFEQVARLLASGIEVQQRNGHFDRFILNDPSVPDEYMRFRRIVMHLAWLQQRRELFVSTLRFDRTLLAGLKNAPSVEDLFRAGGLSARRKADGSYDLVEATLGRLLISNYDPRALSNEEALALNDVAQGNPKNFAMVDIRADRPGGAMPLFGAFKLRSLIEVLGAVGRGIEAAPEHDVARDPRTGGGGVSPRSTLAILRSDAAPADDAPVVRYRGRFYSVADTPWDRAGFFMLNLLFQFSVSDVSNIGIPITISK